MFGAWIFFELWKAGWRAGVGFVVALGLVVGVLCGLCVVLAR